MPVRQWVLTLPYRLRYRLAWHHAPCRAVLGVYARVLLAFYARTAQSHGIQDGQTGTVTVIQRFGSGLQLNVHMHTLVLDGVFSEARPGQLTFHPALPPSDEDVTQVLTTVNARVGQLLEASLSPGPAAGWLRLLLDHAGAEEPDVPGFGGRSRCRRDPSPPTRRLVPVRRRMRARPKLAERPPPKQRWRRWRY